MKESEAINILDLKFNSTDLDKVVSIRKYFYEIMKTLWIEQEAFSGKRPFGNSGWDGDLIICLIKNKLVEGTLDEDGYPDDYEPSEIDKLVINKIMKPLFGIKSKN